MSHHDDYAFEPIPGLPELPPEGEKILWQGAPEWRGLALRAFHARKVAVYFGIFAAWKLVLGLTGDRLMADAALSALGVVVLGAAAVGLLVYLARISARTTVYTITNQRVVMRVGMAMPVTINLPFSRIESAALATTRDGLGDIPLKPVKGNRVAYAVLWPHARPWRIAHPEPMLRSLEKADEVSKLLADAWTTSLEDAPAQQIIKAPQPAAPDHATGPGGLVPAE